MPKVAILIVSYAHDLAYLRYNLDSIDKFCAGFSGVTVVVPHDEVSEFASLAAVHRCDLRVYNRNADKLKWHLDAQRQKCYADYYCPQADFILHTDSDCIFTEPVMPDDYFQDGKPIMCIKGYQHIPDSPWKSVTEAAVKHPVFWSFMERHPQVNPRRLYPLMRTRMLMLHGWSFDQWFLSRKPTFPWGISEHNLLGAVAFDEMRDEYHWHDVIKDGMPHEKLRQFWSYSPPDKKQDSPHGEPPCAPIDIIQKVLAS